jgi:hypothetical protein
MRLLTRGVARVNNTIAMSLINSLREKVVGQAMKFASSPTVSKLATDPRLMNAAMKAMNLGSAVKTNLDRAGKVAAGTFGWATQGEVASLRSTIQTLEDQLASLEAKTSLASQPSAPAKSGPSFSKPGP